MLKILSFFSALMLTSLAEGGAFSLDCASVAGFSSRGRAAAATVQGVWEPLEFGHSRLNYRLSYGLDCGPEASSCWASAAAVGQGILAQRDYAPTRYEGFSKFILFAEPGREHRHLLLPSAVPTQAGRFNAYLQLDGVEGSYGTTLPLVCEGHAVKSQRSAPSEDAKAEIARANRILQQDFGFADLKLQADERALQKQIDAANKGTVSVSAATSLAVALILDDFRAVESPLNIAAEGNAGNQDQQQAAKALLRTEMEKGRTTLSLYLGQTVSGSIYPPEYGESEQANWIFVLRVPTLSDHIYWVIVDKSGKQEPYLYGFN